MPSPLPGSPEHFFGEVAKFLRANMQGDIRCLVISETSSGQLWVNAMGMSTAGQLGMLASARVAVEEGFRNTLRASQEQIAKDLEEQKLKAVEVQGKPQ